NRGAHADKAARLDSAAVQHDGVTDRNVVAQDQRPFVLHYVEHRAILHVRARADADVIHIASRDNQRPDALVFAGDDVPDEDARSVNIRRSGDLGPLAFIRPNVGLSVQENLVSCCRVTVYRAPSDSILAKILWKITLRAAP